MKAIKILLALLAVVLFSAPAEALDQEAAPSRQHLIFFAGTNQELEVYRIFGRRDGPTVMIMGGIQGDEPGGFLSADLYADLTLARGNLIVVPRANFPSIIQAHRGPTGDMNRKFAGDLSQDPDRQIVEVLKDLMAESDLLLNLHDGSGYYRPTWESNMANPKRYGQCIIADANTYTLADGQVINLQENGQAVVDRVNEEITEPLYKFHFHNTRTDESTSGHKEQRKSATYYALTEVGIPAYGVETSKQLPTLEMKIHQHNLAINAFLDIFGVVPEQPSFHLEEPDLGYVIIKINGKLPLAVSNGQTLELKRGTTIEIVHIAANSSRGLSADILGVGGYNDLSQPLAIVKPTTVMIQKDHNLIGRINLTLIAENEPNQSPRLLGKSQIRSPGLGQKVKPEEVLLARSMAPRSTSEVADSAADEDAPLTRSKDRFEVALTGRLTVHPDPATSETPTRPDPKNAPEVQDVAEIELTPEPQTVEPAAKPAPPRPSPASDGKVTAFVIEVNGKTVELTPGQELEILSGSLVKMVEIKSNGPLPSGVVMNLKGFVPKSKQYANNGDDRGFTADTSQLMPEFSQKQKGLIYEIKAERGRKNLGAVSLKLLKFNLTSVTFEFDGQSHTLKKGHGRHVPIGTKVKVLSVKLADGLTLTRPRFTLGGRAFPSDLPQTVTMPGFNANLAVFNGQNLVGKVTWWAAPRQQ